MSPENGRSGKIPYAASRSFWRLAIEKNPRIFRRKTAGFLTKKTSSPAA